MAELIDAFRIELQNGLKDAAKGYLKVGLQAYHKEEFQVAMGNLSIAIELMLKLCIASRDMSLIFKSLPLELRVGLASGSNNINWRMHHLQLRESIHKTIEIDECVSCFYILHPHHKQTFGSYFRHLSNIRNVAVHSFLVSFNSYHSTRAAYLAIKLAEILRLEDSFGLLYVLNSRDKEFIKKYDEERTNRVQRAVDEAKERAKRLTGNVPLSAESWEEFVEKCPVCNCDALLIGDTELEPEVGNETADVYLVFKADSMECKQCGLKLTDVQELALAGMDTTYDRWEDFEQWSEEFHSWDDDDRPY